MLTTPPRRKNRSCYETDTGRGPVLTIWYQLSNGKETCDLVHGMSGACIAQGHLRQLPGN